MHDFKTSLAKGKQGEALLLTVMPQLEPLDGKRSDFIHKDTNELYELKSDQYDMRNTENFFIELYSDLDRKKVGGPAQALEHHSKYWIYMFVKNRVLFIFETELLVRRIEKIKSAYISINIQNATWTTTGIKVLRKDLEDLYTKVEF